MTTTPTVGVPNTPGRYSLTYASGYASRFACWLVRADGLVRPDGTSDDEWHRPGLAKQRATWTPLPDKPTETPRRTFDDIFRDDPEPLPLTFGCRVRAGDIEGVWREHPADECAGMVEVSGERAIPVPRGMERHLVVLAPAAPARPAWTEKPRACGIDGRGELWLRFEADRWSQTGTDEWFPWSEVPQPLRELVVREEER